jgi:hypothetical protein
VALEVNAHAPELRQVVERAAWVEVGEHSLKVFLGRMLRLLKLIFLRKNRRFGLKTPVNYAKIGSFIRQVQRNVKLLDN